MTMNPAHSKPARLWLMLGFLAALTACSKDDNPSSPGNGGDSFDLTFTGTIAPHAGQKMEVIVIRADDGGVAAYRETVVPGDGNFSFTWTDVLARGSTYHIDFYADHNGDGSCDDTPTDHAWRITSGPVTADVTQDFQHDTNFTDICDSFEFDLDFTATLAPHSGQIVRVAIVKIGSGGEEDVVATDQTTVPANGAVAFTWADELEYDHDYVLDFYADHNGNGTCDAPPTDHAWRMDLGTVTGDIVRDFQHDTNFTDVCGSFTP